MVATTFWETFFLLLIFLPLVLVWGFALLDIFRRDDMGGASKALWVAAVILVPFLGTLLYLIVRPAGATYDERVMIEQQNQEVVARYAPTDPTTELKTLADLHERGKLTDAEFAAEKARLLGTSPTAAA
ncbi:MAG TPA: SHOCT domain-containing protein [Gaiellaceae bacterium]|nr:SHOCT domain-containing protein [Gaiellaceae bacterium]